MFKKLIKDEKSIFYAADKITRTLLNKARKHLYEKYKIFYIYYLFLEDKHVFYEKENTETRIPFYTSFVKQKKKLIDLLPCIVLKRPLSWYMHT